MKCQVVGKNTFVSKKSNSECFVLHCVTPFSASSTGCTGKQVLTQFVNKDTFDSIPVPCEVDLTYNYRGYIENVNILK